MSIVGTLALVLVPLLKPHSDKQRIAELEEKIAELESERFAWKHDNNVLVNHIADLEQTLHEHYEAELVQQHLLQTRRFYSGHLANRVDAREPYALDNEGQLMDWSECTCTPTRSEALDKLRE